MELLIAPFRMMIDLGEVVVIALLGIALIGLFIWGVVEGIKNLLFNLEPHAERMLWGNVVIDVLAVTVLLIFILTTVGAMIIVLTGGSIE